MLINIIYYKIRKYSYIKSFIIIYNDNCCFILFSGVVLMFVIEWYNCSMFDFFYDLRC